MEEVKFIWYESPEIWAAIIAGVCALITAIGSGLFFWKKNKILTNFQKDIKEHEVGLNTKMEIIKIQYGALYGERLNVIREVHKSILKIINYYCEVSKLKTIYKGKGIDNTKLDDKDHIEMLRINLELQEMDKHRSEFMKYFNEHKLFLSKDLENIICGFCEIIEAGQKRIFKQMIQESEDSEENYRELSKPHPYDVYDTILDNPKETFNRVLSSIEHEFRELIGSNIKTKNE